MEAQATNGTQMSVMSIPDQVRAINVGAHSEFPASKYCTVQTAKSRIAIELDRTFKTKYDKENKVLIVTRTR